MADIYRPSRPRQIGQPDDQRPTTSDGIAGGAPAPVRTFDRSVDDHAARHFARERKAQEDAAEAAAKAAEDQQQAQVQAANYETDKKAKLENRETITNPATGLREFVKSDEQVDQEREAEAAEERRKAQIAKRNDRLEQQFREQGREFFTDSAGRIRPVHSEEEFAAMQEEKAREERKRRRDERRGLVLATAEQTYKLEQDARPILPKEERDKLAGVTADRLEDAVYTTLAAKDLSPEAKARLEAIASKATEAGTRLTFDDLPEDLAAEVEKRAPEPMKAARDQAASLAADEQNRQWRSEREREIEELRLQKINPKAWKALQQEAADPATDLAPAPASTGSSPATAPQTATTPASEPAAEPAPELAEAMPDLEALYKSKANGIAERKARIEAQQSRGIRQMENLLAENAALAAQGGRADDFIAMQMGDEVRQIHKSILPRMEAVQKSTAARNPKLDEEIGALETEVEELNELGKQLNRVREKEQRAKQAEFNAWLDKLDEDPEYRPIAGAFRDAEMDYETRRADIENDFTLSPKERQTAELALIEDRKASFAAANQALEAANAQRNKRADGMAKLMEFATSEASMPVPTNQGVTPKAADSIYRRQREQIRAIAEESGIPVTEAARMVRDYHDTTRPWGQEGARVLSTGKVAVNPALAWDDAAYRAAIESTGAKPEAKVEAIAKQKGLQDALAAPIAAGLRKLGAFQRFEERQNALPREQRPRTEGDLVRRYYAERGGAQKFFDNAALTIKQGGNDIAAQFFGFGYGFGRNVLHLPKGWRDKNAYVLEDLGATDGSLNASNAEMDAAMDAAGVPRLVRDIGRAAVSTVPALATGGLGAGSRAVTMGILTRGSRLGTAGRVLLGNMGRQGFTQITPKMAARMAQQAGLGGAGAGAFAQTFGSEYPAAVAAFQERGMSFDEAADAALVPAAGAATFTSAVTMAFGKTGVEKLLRGKAAGDVTAGDLARLLTTPQNRVRWIKTMRSPEFKKMAENLAISLGRDIGAESIEEGLDSLYTSLIRLGTYETDDSRTVADAIGEGLHGALIGAVLGAGGNVGQAVITDAGKLIRPRRGAPVMAVPAPPPTTSAGPQNGTTTQPATPNTNGQETQGLQAEEVTPTGAAGNSATQADPAAPAPVVTTLVEQWDLAHKNSRTDEWFEGGRASEAANAGFADAATEKPVSAHGMAKESTLIGGLRNLLTLIAPSGVDTNRGRGGLDTAPLVSGASGAGAGTASGGAYVDGPFVVLARDEATGLITDSAQIGAVLVNEANIDQLAEIEAAIRAVRSDIVVAPYSRAGEAIRKMRSAVTPSPSPAPSPAPSGAPAPAGSATDPATAGTPAPAPAPPAEPTEFNRRPERLALAQQEIDEAMAGGNPDFRRANAMRRIAMGETDALSATELAEIGLERGEQGQIRPRKLSKLEQEAGPVAPMAAMEGDQVILTAEGLDWLQGNFPRTRQLVSMGEPEARQFFRDRAAAAEAANQSPEISDQQAAEEELAADDDPVGDELEAAGIPKGEPIVSPIPVDEDFDAAEQRVEELTAYAVERFGWDRSYARAQAVNHVRKHGVTDPDFIIQALGLFEPEMRAQGKLKGAPAPEQATTQTPANSDQTSSTTNPEPAATGSLPAPETDGRPSGNAKPNPAPAPKPAERPAPMRPRDAVKAAFAKLTERYQGLVASLEEGQEGDATFWADVERGRVVYNPDEVDAAYAGRENSDAEIEAAVEEEFWHLATVAALLGRFQTMAAVREHLGKVWKEFARVYPAAAKDLQEAYNGKGRTFESDEQGGWELARMAMQFRHTGRTTELVNRNADKAARRVLEKHFGERGGFPISRPLRTLLEAVIEWVTGQPTINRTLRELADAAKAVLEDGYVALPDQGQPSVPTPGQIWENPVTRKRFVISGIDDDGRVWGRSPNSRETTRSVSLGPVEAFSKLYRWVPKLKSKKSEKSRPAGGYDRDYTPVLNEIRARGGIRRRISRFDLSIRRKQSLGLPLSEKERKAKDSWANYNGAPGAGAFDARIAPFLSSIWRDENNADVETPDTMAEQLYRDNVIPDAYPDTLWEAIGAELSSIQRTEMPLPKNATKWDKREQEWKEDAAQYAMNWWQFASHFVVEDFTNHATEAFDEEGNPTGKTAVGKDLARLKRRTGADLALGDNVTVDGEELMVAGIDDSGVRTLSNGLSGASRFYEDLVTVGPEEVVYLSKHVDAEGSTVDPVKRMRQASGAEDFMVRSGRPMTERDAFDKFVATAKREISSDIESGEIPDTVGSFADLNDYVDANGYVNDANRPDRALGPLGRSLGWGPQDYVNFTNRVIEEIDRWMASGRPSIRAARPGNTPNRFEAEQFDLLSSADPEPQTAEDRQAQLQRMQIRALQARRLRADDLATQEDAFQDTRAEEGTGQGLLFSARPRSRASGIFAARPRRPEDRARRLMQRIDAMYLTGRVDGVEDLEAQLEAILEQTDTDLEAMDEGDDADRVAAMLESDMAEFDSAPPDPEAQLVQFWLNWNGAGPAYLSDLARQQNATFGQYVRNSLGDAAYTIADGVTDQQIEEAAIEAADDYRRRRSAMLAAGGPRAARPRNPGNYPASLESVVRSTKVKNLITAGLKAGESLVPLDPYAEKIGKAPDLTSVSPDYRSAKKDGNGSAAARIIRAVIKPSAIEELRARLRGIDNPRYVPVRHSDVGLWHNALPPTYARYLKETIGGTLDTEIYKASGKALTNAGTKERLATIQEFAGPVDPDGKYVVVDDTYTSGNTITALIDHIHTNGGEVVAVTTLADSQTQNYLKPREQDVEKFLARAGVSRVEFERDLGFPINALTGSEIYRLAHLERGWSGTKTLAERFRDRSGVFRARSEADRQGVHGGDASSRNDLIRSARPRSAPRETEPGFYSQLEEVIREKIPTRATPQQILAAIEAADDYRRRRSAMLAANR